jgi:hypothetical protein
VDHIGAPEGETHDVAAPLTQTGAAQDGRDDGPEAGRVWRPSSHKTSTRGGSGASAGSTPKKSYRPSASSRPRPAGKKPSGGH